MFYTHTAPISARFGVIGPGEIHAAVSSVEAITYGINIGSSLSQKRRAASGLCKGKIIGMYVRFKEYVSKDKRLAWRLEVVRPYRDPVTQIPQNETIVYLGTVREEHLKYQRALTYIWGKLDAKLAQLSLSDSDEQKVRSQLQARMPRPDNVSDTSASPPRNSFEVDLKFKIEPTVLASAKQAAQPAEVDEVPTARELQDCVNELLSRLD